MSNTTGLTPLPEYSPLAPEGNAPLKTGIYRPLANTMAFATGSVERMRISVNGYLGIGTNDPRSTVDIRNASGYRQLRLQTPYTPTGTSDPNGNEGDIAWDDDYIYVKTSAGWKRTQLSTF